MPNAQEQAFVILAHQRGLLTPDALRVTNSHPAGEDLADALVRGGHLTVGARRDIGRDLLGREFVCEPCRRRLRLSDLAGLADLACPTCRTNLVVSAPAGVAQSFGTGAFEAQLAASPAKTIGPYTLYDELGRGCMGVVYRATKPGLARDFALKIMLGDADDEDIQRFRLEAQVASKLNDPGIIGVFDIGKDQGRHYYVMDYCPGTTLRDLLASSDPSFEEIVKLVEQVARTIHNAHQLSVVHRDLKPANILLEEGSGRPRITDFGLAKDPTLVRNLTQSGDILGTPYYMSPEQFRGGKDIDHRVDVWALGVILYEAITRERPFEGADFMEVAKKVRKSRPTAPRSINPKIPADLEAICLCALAKDPANRYLSAEALAEDLAAFLRGDTPSHASGIAAPVGHRTPTIAVAVAVALGAAVAVAVAVSVSRVGPPPSDPDSQKSPPISKAIAEGALLQARALARASGDVKEARTAFDQAIDLATSPEAVAEATVAKAAFLLRRGYPQEAAICVRALQGDEGELALEALRIRAQAHEALGDREHARRAYAELERADPDGVRGLTARAARARLGNSAEAKELAELAVARGADYGPALFESIVAHARAEGSERERALLLLERAKALAPDTPRLLFCEAMLTARADSERGRRLLTRAIELSANRPESGFFRTRGLFAAQAGLFADAEADLNRAIELAPGNAQNLAHRGSFFWSRAQQEWEDPSWEARALSDWRRAQDAEPNAFDRFLDSLPAATREKISAALAPDTTRDTWPLGAPVRKELAGRVRKAQFAGRKLLLRALLKAAAAASWDEVESLCDIARDAAPECPVVALECARVFVGREGYERGFREIERARGLESNDARYDLKLDWLEAELYWLAGQAYEAAPRFERLITDDTHGSEGMLARAQALMAHERNEQAEVAIARSLDYDPDHTPSLTIKAALLLNRMPPAIAEAEEVLDQVARLDGAVTCRVMRGRFEARYLRLFFKEDGSMRSMLMPQRVEPIMNAYERLFPTSPGTGLLLDAAQYMLMIKGDHPWHARIEGWLRDSIQRRPQLGMSYVLLRRLRIQRKAPQEEVLEAWRQAKTAEKRIRYSPAMLDEYRAFYGGPCPELAEFNTE